MKEQIMEKYPYKTELHCHTLRAMHDGDVFWSCDLNKTEGRAVKRALAA